MSRIHPASSHVSQLRQRLHFRNYWKQRDACIWQTPFYNRAHANWLVDSNWLCDNVSISCLIRNWGLGCIDRDLKVCKHSRQARQFVGAQRVIYVGWDPSRVILRANIFEPVDFWMLGWSVLGVRCESYEKWTTFLCLCGWNDWLDLPTWSGRPWRSPLFWKSSNSFGTSWCQI